MKFEYKIVVAELERCFLTSLVIILAQSFVLIKAFYVFD